ncbi:cell wall hydrolase [Anaerocolumna xylanovorans]|uniref:Cell Wall Hydrolase n=1 Tax=Anaerocolumna xylanovorans DSM 12503 TaxID=1121345 RepID=A0A1M7Y4C0_9FIRM|nr:cell wall hydrolase [Anaerocolumna xylanovorans]SHO47134.1 Cell Wall Hydrolase [Anaerocolumna xylanovorans DSM 12503]
MLKIHSFLQRAFKPVKAMIPLSGKNKAVIAAAVLYIAVTSFLILSPDTIYEHSSIQKAPVYTSGNLNGKANGIGEETAIEAIVRTNPVIYKKAELVQSGLEAYGIQCVNPYIPFKNKAIITAHSDSKTVVAKENTTLKEAVQATAKSRVDSSSTKEKTKNTEAASTETKKTVRQEAKNTVKKTEYKVKLSNGEIEVLQRIVEAEATGEDVKGKMLVANVILNRVSNKDFPDTVKDVVFQKDGHTYQFSPIKDGRYYSVKVSEGTKKAIRRVLNGEDYSHGALYFSARIRADKNSMSWFDRHLKFLFKYGGHEFFK